MEDFDFTTPVNATVIFDDSDEEIFPCNDDVQTNKEKANDDNSHKSVDCFTNKEKQVKNYIPMITTEFKIIEEGEFKRYSTETDTLKRRIDTGSNWSLSSESKTESGASLNDTSKKPSLKKLDFEEGSTTSQINNLQISTNKLVVKQTHPVHECKNKIKTSVHEQQSHKKRLKMGTDEQVLKSKSNVSTGYKLSKTENGETATHENFASNAESLIQVCNQSKNINEIAFPQTQAKQLQINDQHINVIQVLENIKTSTPTSQASTIIPHHNSTNCADELLPQSINSTEKITKLRESLKTVSEYMIYIINSYQTCIQIQKASAEQSLIKHAKDNFHRTKNHFFDLSYKTVLNYIIPMENDVAFVKNFLNYTIKLAQIKSYPFTYAHMEPLYLEMITWVKKRRDDVQNTNKKNTSNLLPVDVPNINSKNTSNLLPIPALEHNEHLRPYTNHYSDQSQKQTLPQKMQNTNPGINRLVMDSTRIPLPSYRPNLQQTHTPTRLQQIHGPRENLEPFNYCGIPPPYNLTHKGQSQKHSAQQQTQVASPELHRLVANSFEIPSHSYLNRNLEQIQGSAMQQHLLNNSQGVNRTKSFDSFGTPTPFLNNIGQIQNAYNKMTINRKSDKTSGGFQLYPHLNYGSAPIPKTTTQQNIQKSSTDANRNSITLSGVLERNINMGSKVPNKQIVDRQPCSTIASPPQNAHFSLRYPVCNMQTQKNNLKPPSYNEAMQWDRQTTQSCLQQAPWHNEGREQNSPQNQGPDSTQNNQPFRIEMSAPAESNRSSISRDSGFISPLNFNSSSDQLYIQETSNTKSKPNDSYLDIKCGFCALCGKNSEQQCLGCSKCFYCSKDCQLLDWKRHKAICK